MKTVVYKVKDAQGKTVEIKSSRFTKKELDKFPKKEREAILSFRRLSDSMVMMVFSPALSKGSKKR